MVELIGFKIWLFENKKYSKKTVSNIVSRFKRVNKIIPWKNEPIYFFEIEQNKDFSELKGSVKSQIKKAIKLYQEYDSSKSKKTTPANNKRPNVLSLFSNIGVAEAYLEEIGFHVAIANELLERRARLYSRIYPNTNMICGDITDENIQNRLIEESRKVGIDIVMATPPCQGMSNAGQQEEDDERNELVRYVVDFVQNLHPKYVFIENVPLFYQTKITIDNNKVLIPDYITDSLDDAYRINFYTVDTKDYSVPQTRERAIVLMTRNDVVKEWIMPEKDERIITMRDAIGHLPMIDPFVMDVSKEELLRMFPHYYEREEQALRISHWNRPPEHIKRQVVAMQHTPTGCTAFDNPVYYPIKENGERVKGYRNTYKRQNWDTPAYTVTMDNRKISSQNNVHPGREEYIDADGNQIYSDPRTLTLYELMRIMSLPDTWPVPADTSEAFLRRIIGEGIPPLFVKKVFECLLED